MSECTHRTIYRRALHGGDMWLCSLCGIPLGSGSEQPFARIAAMEALLPDAYMDPPDGGDVSLIEQMRRMAADAKRWRTAVRAVGWMVGTDPLTAALYNLGEREQAYDAARRWGKPITPINASVRGAAAPLDELDASNPNAP